MTALQSHSQPNQQPVTEGSASTVKIHYQGQSLALRHNETVLECLLRENIELRHSCRQGLCQSCLLRVDLNASERAREDLNLYQQGLTQPQIEQGYFLACCSRPSCDITVLDANGGESATGSAVQQWRIIDKTMEGEHTWVLKLQPDTEPTNQQSSLHSSPAHSNPAKASQIFRGGQFVNIWREPNTIRSYSIANVLSITSPQGPNGTCPSIELHIRRYPSGAFSAATCDQLSVDDSLFLQGPLGQCYYTEDCRDRPLQLFGIGTGLAPLLGILRSALQSGHSAPIRLVIGAKDAANFYQLDTLMSLSTAHDNVDISLIAQQGELPSIATIETLQADIYQYCCEAKAFDPAAMIFICGAESFVGKMKKRCFLAGASLQDIRADAFLQADSNR